MYSAGKVFREIIKKGLIHSRGWLLKGCLIVTILFCGCASKSFSLEQMQTATDTELTEMQDSLRSRFLATRSFGLYNYESYLSDKDAKILYICEIQNQTLFWENWQARTRDGYILVDHHSSESLSSITNAASLVKTFKFRSLVFTRTPIRKAVKAILEQVKAQFPEQGFDIVVDRDVENQEITISARFMCISEFLSLLNAFDTAWSLEGNIIRIRKQSPTKATPDQ